MLQIGKYQNLTIERQAPPGLYLSDGEEEVLLPNKYIPDDFRLGDTLEVFVYKDHLERPVATTLKPLLTIGEMALLNCTDVTDHGAFMDWGMEKQLLVPFREQAMPLKVDVAYMVYLYLDEKTGRLVGSTRIDRFLDNDKLTAERFQEVPLLIYAIDEQGARVVVNNSHQGLIYHQDIFEELRVGDQLKGFVKKIRPDNKLDIVLHAPGYKGIAPNAQYILDELKQSGGKLDLHDKSTPEEIRDRLGLSKKSFKKAIGQLYKERQVRITENGIELL
jgi:predicted RNA-binding protein (virulence factor B family)